LSLIAGNSMVPIGCGDVASCLTFSCIGLSLSVRLRCAHLKQTYAARSHRSMLFAPLKPFLEVPTIRRTVLATQPADERHEQLADPVATEVDVDRDKRLCALAQRCDGGVHDRPDRPVDAVSSPVAGGSELRDLRCRRPLGAT